MHSQKLRILSLLLARVSRRSPLVIITSFFSAVAIAHTPAFSRELVSSFCGEGFAQTHGEVAYDCEMPGWNKSVCGFAPPSRLSSSSRFLTRDYAASDPRSGSLVAAGIRTAAHVQNKLRSQNILVPELYHCSPRINCMLSVPYIIADNTCPNFSFPT